MQHKIPESAFGPRGHDMASAVQACVHCGFCLPTCPTYQVLGDETESPRGRILLMKQVLEGSLAPAEAQPHLDRCLGCLACVTACPSGVQYGELISPFRALQQTRAPRSFSIRIRRQLASWTIPYPKRFRFALQLGRIGRRLRSITPSSLHPMLDLVPAKLPAPYAPPPRTEAIGPRRARVALLTGCAQQVLAPEINAATIRVLARQGIEVVCPSAQGCCGALAWHIGDDRSAQRLARVNLDAFPTDVDAILTNAAGCGSGLHEYPLILRGTDAQSRAEAFAKRVCDVSVFLDHIGFRSPPSSTKPLRLVYHDACHLSHAQGVTSAPRKLLQSIGNVQLLEPEEPELCCGSAGTYNIDQPTIAAQLGERKANHLRATNPDGVALGNIGCQVQISRYLPNLPVLHTFQWIDRCYGEG
jgi:glycolate oxidase iron-sulfur subunit